MINRNDMIRVSSGQAVRYIGVSREEKDAQGNPMLLVADSNGTPGYVYFSDVLGWGEGGLGFPCDWPVDVVAALPQERLEYPCPTCQRKNDYRLNSQGDKVWMHQNCWACGHRLVHVNCPECGPTLPR